MIVVVVDTSAALLTLPREYIPVLKWLVGIDMMVVHIEDNCMELEEQIEAQCRIPERVVARVDS
jgi:hypothetical protein